MFRSPTFVLAWLTSFLAGVYALGGGSAQADAINVFSLPSGQTSLSFVTVGDPGNAPDSTGFGSVGYTYQMSTYDTTVAQYCAFLNATATTSDTFGLYNQSMLIPVQSGGNGSFIGITQIETAGNFTYTVADGSGNYPATSVSWGDAARFCNWLSNGQPDTGAENSTTTEDGSYALNGAVTSQALNLVPRSPNATYVIPTENEFYKSAYYDPTLNGTGGYWLYPTKSNTAPSNVLSATESNNANFEDPILGLSNPPYGLTIVGAYANSPSAYGTYDQGGDVFQWNEAIAAGERGIRGGDFDLDSSYLQSGGSFSSPPSAFEPVLGFRVAEVPEPGSVTLVILCAAGLLARRGPRRSANI